MAFNLVNGMNKVRELTLARNELQIKGDEFIQWIRKCDGSEKWNEHNRLKLFIDGNQVGLADALIKYRDQILQMYVALKYGIHISADNLYCELDVDITPEEFCNASKLCDSHPGYTVLNQYASGMSKEPCVLFPIHLHD